MRSCALGRPDKLWLWRVLKGAGNYYTYLPASSFRPLFSSGSRPLPYVMAGGNAVQGIVQGWPTCIFYILHKWGTLLSAIEKML